MGIYYIKVKRNFGKHRLSMGVATLVNAVLIIFIMARSFLALSSILVEKFYEFISSITLVHATVGGLAEILGISYLLRHPRKVRTWMRLTAVLWVTALLLGIAFYIYVYVS